ncbi:hypothetical protein CLOSTMETH_03015 [[Clostridium] methylpentosum DSM 5476]|uniref:Uncharacterized protein n=1 Tax=[Clostridium] methylpentosum DSM 5476 TaxID=537013 RepID=C0EGM3_9FIRM|nr:hypothetical protein CLOSTMETH_03015 [[Clostridium] methylpentosum DSM 5476]
MGKEKNTMERNTLPCVKFCCNFSHLSFRNQKLSFRIILPD